MDPEEPITNHQQLVKESLLSFLSQHTPPDNSNLLSSVDEIILNYVIGILEELGSCTDGDYDDVFDVDDFTEMMAAYLPGFQEINSSVICEWMFELSGRLSDAAKDPSMSAKSDKVEDELSLLINQHLGCGSPRYQTLSSRSRNSSSSQMSDDSTDEFDKELEQLMESLQETFPGTSAAELAHCLSLSSWNSEKAIPLVLERQAAGESIQDSTPLQSLCRRIRHNSLDDKQLKESILSRYAYVDKADDTREHKPLAPKWEGKKLIRYRDNKVVSIKGERYTEVKRDDEEENLKKTYVNLKPARQYRFH